MATQDAADLQPSLSGDFDPPLFVHLVLELMAASRRNGYVRATNEGLAGQVLFNGGNIVAAACGQERGLAALEAVVLTLAGGQFELFITDALPSPHPLDGLPPVEEDCVVPSEGLPQYFAGLLREHAELARVVPSVAAVPRLAPGVEQWASEEPALTPASVATLLAVDGVRSVAEIIGARASAKRLKHLAALAKLDLICFEDWAQPGRDRPPTAGPRQLRDANPDGRALAVWTAEPTALAEGTAHPQAGLGGPLNLADVMEKTRELERQRARGSAEGELSGSLPGIVRVAASLLRRGPSQGRDPSG